MSSIKFGDVAMPKRRISASYEKALNDYVSSQAQDPIWMKPGATQIDLLESFDWNYLISIPEHLHLVMRIESRCSDPKCYPRTCRKSHGPPRHQQITPKEIRAAIAHQVAIDTEKFARDALGPAQKQRFLDMTAWMKDPKAQTVQREVCLLRALDIYREALESKLEGYPKGTRIEMALPEMPELLKSFKDIQTMQSYHDKIHRWGVFIVLHQYNDVKLISQTDGFVPKMARKMSHEEWKVLRSKMTVGLMH